MTPLWQSPTTYPGQPGPARWGQVMELEAEEAWLRKRIVRLRTVLRYANDPRTEAGLREFIGDAEHRLELLQNRRPVVQQQQQVQPKKARSRKLVGKRELTALA